MTEFLPLRPGAPPALPHPNTATLRDVARELEVSFLAEMLKSAGVGEQTSSFAGGVGENQFAMLQRQAMARDMAAGGGIGLTEHIFKSLTERQDGT